MAATHAGIGDIYIPAEFRYGEVFRRGRPVHGTAGKPATYDAFYLKHPPMEAGRRAKIFAPFDALKGFSACIASKQVLYEPRRELTEGEKEALDRRLEYLQRCTGSMRQGSSRPTVTADITYFTTCSDPESEAFDSGMGQYSTVSGNVRKVDLIKKTICLDDMIIRIGDITDIEISGDPGFEESCLGA